MRSNFNILYVAESLIKDLNRGITQIVYNDASLPSSIYFNGNKRYSMNYDADGNLLSRKEIYLSRPGMSYPFVNTLAFGGIEPPTIEPTPFEPLLVSTETDYFGTQHWKGLSLDRIETTDGYIKNDTLSAYYRDYQGNICAVIRGGKLIQATNYYPYGMPIAGGTNPDEQRHKYSGKELLTHYGLNCYDFGPRLYDPALLQFHNPDLLQEKYYGLHAYLYCAANPIRNIDPSGMKIISGMENWEKLKTSILETIGEYNNQYASIETSISLMPENADVFSGALDELKRVTACLSLTLKVMRSLENSSQQYEFNKTDNEYGDMTLGKNNVVQINYTSSSNAVHEIIHAGQFEIGELAFRNGKIMLNDVEDELMAYKAQYSYAPNDVKKLNSTQVVNNISDINHGWLNGLKFYHVGEFVGLTPLNINSTIGDIMKSLPNYTKQSNIDETLPFYKFPGVYYRK